MQFFKISVIYTFLFGRFFFSRQLVEAIARPIDTNFGTNVSSYVGFRMHFRNLEKVKKPGHDEQKTSKFRWNFIGSLHIFAHGDKTVKLKKI